MKKMLLSLIFLLTLCSCTSNTNEPSQQLETEKETESGTIVEENKEPEKEVQLADDGQTIFLPGSDYGFIFEIGVQYKTDVDTQWGKDWRDYSLYINDGYFSVDCSSNSDGELSCIYGLAKKSDDKDWAKIFLCRCVQLGMHDNEEYVYETVRDWVFDNMDGDAEKKFGDANVHIRYNSDSDYYCLDIYTDGNDWWQNKLLQEMMDN